MNCLICGVYIPDGSHVCSECRKQSEYPEMIDIYVSEYEQYNKLLERQKPLEVKGTERK